MRTKFAVVGATLLLVAAGVKAQDLATAAGQQDVPKQATAVVSIPDIEFGNQIDFGIRGTTFGSGSDAARYQRYQDLRDGATLDRFRFTKDTDEFLIHLQADHVGYRDQRFYGSYNNFGKVKATFEWNQVPLFYSESTRTLFSSSAPGVLVLPDTIQSGLQNRTLLLPDAVTGASLFDMRARRDVADARLQYSATRHVDLNVTFKNTLRDGTQPWAGTFGISGIVASELPVPLDQRTTEFGASLQWGNDRGFGKLAYDASLFRNNVSTLTWDNPLRVVDSATAGPAQGRMALWPNSDLNTVSASGGVSLPGRSRATGFVSLGFMSQNDPLVPFTINSALVSPALDRATADLSARVTSMNYSVTSRPTNMLWFSARYRQYQYDNRSTPFYVGQGVNFDTSYVTLNEHTELPGYTRHTFDGDASFSPVSYLAFRGGYTREEIDRSFRIVENTTEDIGRASVDVTGMKWMTVRGVYEHGQRRGTAPLIEELIAIGEQPSLRQFDISDRNRDRVSAIVTVSPLSQFSVNASAGIGKETYPGATFGLRNNDNHVYSVGFDFVPIDAINFGVTYGWEKYTALQASRTANPLPAMTDQYLNDPTQQFNDPRRDWTDDGADKVHTFNASVDLIKLIPKTDVKVGYDYSRAESTYVYGLAANTVIAAPVPLPAVVNQLQRGTVDVRYSLTKHVAAGVVYWYDKYAVNDFALGPLASLAQPATASASLMMIGYNYRPYNANTVWGRLTYLW